MPAKFSPQTFLRSCPNDLLSEYFKRAGCLTHLDIKGRKARDIEDILTAYNELDVTERNRIENDFRCIYDLSNVVGIQNLHRALSYQDIDFPDFGKKRCIAHKALWAFLYQGKIFHDVHKFTMPHASRTYWHTFALPKNARYQKSEERLNALQQDVITYLKTKQWRGDLCVIEHHTFEDKDFIFLYPSDYTMASMIYEKTQFKRQSVQPAFELVFVFQEPHDFVDMYYEGSVDVAWELFRPFAQHIFDVTNLGKRPKQNLALDVFKVPEGITSITMNPENKVREIAIHKLRFSDVQHPMHTWTIEAYIRENRHAVYSQIAQHGFKIDRLKQVGISIWLEGDPVDQPQKVTISPISCCLEHHGRDAKIREFLKENGILKGE